MLWGQRHILEANHGNFVIIIVYTSNFIYIIYIICKIGKC